jgi:hypothetical protein
MEIPQHLKLELIKVCLPLPCVCVVAICQPHDLSSVVVCGRQEIGQTHMRIADGVTTLLQIQGLCCRLLMRAEAVAHPKA